MGWAQGAEKKRWDKMEDLGSEMLAVKQKGIFLDFPLLKKA
jgi:hypothetical protein